MPLKVIVLPMGRRYHRVVERGLGSQSDGPAGRYIIPFPDHLLHGESALRR